MQTGAIRPNGDPQYLIDKFVQNDQSLQFGTLIEFVCVKYFTSICKTLFIRSILFSNYTYVAKYIKIPGKDLHHLEHCNQMAFIFDCSSFNDSFYIIFKNNHLFIDKTFNINKYSTLHASVLRESVKDPQNRVKFHKWLKFVDLFSDINTVQIYREGSTPIGMLLEACNKGYIFDPEYKADKHLKTLLYKYKVDVMNTKQLIDNKEVVPSEYAKHNDELMTLLNKYIQRTTGKNKATVAMVAAAAVEADEGDSGDEKIGSCSDIAIDIDTIEDAPTITTTTTGAATKTTTVGLSAPNDADGKTESKIITSALTRSETYFDVTNNMNVSVHDVGGDSKENGKVENVDAYVGEVVKDLVENNDAPLFDILLRHSKGGQLVDLSNLFQLIEQNHSNSFKSLLLWLTILFEYSKHGEATKLLGKIDLEQVQDKLSLEQVLFCVKMFQAAATSPSKTKRDIIEEMFTFKNFSGTSFFEQILFDRDNALIRLVTLIQTLMKPGDMNGYIINVFDLVRRFFRPFNIKQDLELFDVFLKECKILRISYLDTDTYNKIIKSHVKNSNGDPNYLLKLLLRWLNPSGITFNEEEIDQIYDKFINCCLVGKIYDPQKYWYKGLTNRRFNIPGMAEVFLLVLVFVFFVFFVLFSLFYCA